MKPLRGRKSLGGSSSTKAPVRVNDNLFGTDTVEVILAVSEGPCVGLVQGASGFRVGDVPLVDPGSTTPNISNFELRVHKGTTPADSILPNLGGVGSSKNVGIDMRSEGQQVVASGQQIQIDYIDLRFTFGRLFLTNDKGDEANTTLTLKIEIKPRSASAWGVPFNNDPPDTTVETSGASNYRPGAQTPGSYKNGSFHETYIQSDAPTGSSVNPGAMWFNTALPNWKPSIRTTDNTWVEPANLASSQVGIFVRWSWNDLTGAPRAAWYDTTGQQRSPDAGLVNPQDFLLIPSASQEVYNWNGVSWNDPTEQFTAPTPLAPGVFETTGSTRSAYPREIRIPVARINEPYDIRVTRISKKEDKYYYAQVTWESFQEITRDVFQFPGLAVSHLTIKATDTFTSIPEFTQLWDGRTIRVPSNYDPVARTYAGFWDGTFKIAYSNNPAFVAYDLVMNTEYGKNAYYPEVMDPLDVYEFGKHCDAHGFTMNEYIQDPRSLNETINYIVGTAGGRYVDRGDGYSTILFDADDQPAVALFTQENVIDGLFTYSFTDITSRKNDYKVSYINPLIGWKEDRVRVYDQNSIDVQGDNPEEFIAVGCTDAAEAIKRGRLRLATALTEKTIVAFKTNRQGLYIQPFQVILVADPTAQEVITGRIKSVTTSTSLALRDEIYIEAGIPLTVSFFVGDGKGGFQSRQYALTNSPGKTTTLSLATPLDVTLPAHAVFSIGTPKAFRITGIDEGEDPDQVSFTAIEVNRLKWAFVDGTVDLDDILALQTGPLSRFTYAVTDLQAVGITRADGSVSVVLTWTSSPSLTGGYRVYSSFEGKQSEVIGEPGAATFEIPNVRSGLYIFTVVALSVDKTTESPPAAISFNLSGGFRPVINALNLRLVDEPEAPIFRAKDPKFAWDASTESLLDHYQFEILDGTNTLIFSKSLPKETLEFVFSLAMNKAARNGVPTRSFTVRLRSVDTDGNFSDPALLTVSHPPPQTPQPKLSHTPETLFIEYTRPPGDVLGALAWAELTSGYNPASTTPKYDGDMTQISIPAIANQKYFVRIALYDSYGKQGLNYSIEDAYTVLFGVDVYDPGIPTGLALTSATVKSTTGDLLTSVKGTWNASTGSNFSYFEFELKEGTGDFVRHIVTGTTDTFNGARAGVQYTGRLRAVSRNEIASGWSPEVTITAARNTQPPGPTTRMTATAAFLTASVGWTNPTNKDLAYVEVWESDTTNLADAKLVSKSISNFYIATFDKPFSTKYYWTRSVNTSEVPATSFTGYVQATSAQVQYDQLKEGVIDMTKFAQGLSPVGVVNTLPPVAGYTGPAFVTLTTDGLLYNIVNGQWVTGVDSVNIRGQVQNAQIAAVAAGKVTGQIVETQIANDAISSPKILAGAITAGKIAALAVVAGTIAAGAVVAGTIATDAVTSNTILANAITTAKISAGAVKADQIDALAVTTDKLAAQAVVAEKIASQAIVTRTLASSSVTADIIAASAITADKIQANAIQSSHIATNSLQADRITLGSSGVGLSSWMTGGNSALFDGGKISANSIAANKIVVGGRNLTIHGLAFSVDKSSRVVSWTNGGIGYINDGGGTTGIGINAGSYNTSGGITWFYWLKDAQSVSVTTDWATAINNSSGNAVLLCTYDGFAGLNPLYAGSIIDGTRINTGTITATQIAASTIQAGNIAAGAIQAINIGANQITADKLGAGTINVNGAINLGSDRFQLIAPQRRIRIFTNNNLETVSLGDVTPWITGNESAQNYGIIIRGPGNVEVLKAYEGGVFINGAYIGTATIQSAAIGNAQIKSANIEELTVGNSKISNNAVTQCVASKNAGGQSAAVQVQSRSGSSKFVIMGFRKGSGGQRYNSGSSSGNLYLEYSTDGSNYGILDSIPCVTSYQYDQTVQANFVLLQATTMMTQWEPGYTGAIIFRCRDDNGVGINGVFIVAMELAK